jgi:DNA primase
MPFRKAQQVWAEHLGVADFKLMMAAAPAFLNLTKHRSPMIPVGFVEPKKLDEKMVAALEDAANFYNDLLMSNEDRFKHIWDYLARRGVEKETIRKFNIGYAPPYSDEHTPRQGTDRQFPATL